MKKINSLPYIVLTLSLLLSGLSFAAEQLDPFSCQNKKTLTDGTSIIKKTQAAYQAVSGLSAEFEQTSILLGMADSFKSQGSLLFLRPGKMNWEYSSPKVQKFVSDGETVWFYEPDVNQVTVGKLSQSFDSQVPVSFLLGVGDLVKSFDAKEVCKHNNKITLVLSPKLEQPNLKSFVLLVDSENYLPQGARIVDVGDTSTQFEFKNLKKEAGLDPSMFEFEVPEGADIINR